MKNIAIIIVFFSIVGCTKILDKSSSQSPTNDNFPASEAELTLAINNVYNRLYWNTTDVPNYLWFETTTDLAYCRGDYAGALTIQQGQYNSESIFPGLAWSNFYTAIERCNAVLDKMYLAQGVVSETFYNRIKGQALFFRAFYYNYLTSLYGDVPYITHVLTLEESKNIEKTSKDEIVKMCYQDLDSAINYLPVSWGSSDKGRVDQGTAQMLKARIALYNGDYKMAKELCKAIIDGGTYSLNSDYKSLFQYQGVNSPEIMFSIPYSIGIASNGIPIRFGPRNLGGYSVFIPTQNLVDLYLCTDGKPISTSTLYNSADPFSNRDKRLAATVLHSGEWFAKYLFQAHPDSTTTLRDNGTDTVRVANQDATNPYATFSGYIFKKYNNESDYPSQLGSSTQSVILFRYAEVLLTYAEAKIELNELDQSVVDAINQTRIRGGLPNISISNQDELRKTIRLERAIEFAGEGLRLFDLRRWKYAEKVMPGALIGKRFKSYWYASGIVPTIDEYQHVVYPNASTVFQTISNNLFDVSKIYLWPIPLKEITLNPKLIQNPNF